jgi:hypothetical protein
MIIYHVVRLSLHCCEAGLYGKIPIVDPCPKPDWIK